MHIYVYEAIHRNIDIYVLFLWRILTNTDFGTESGCSKTEL